MTITGYFVGSQMKQKMHWPQTKVLGSLTGFFFFMEDWTGHSTQALSVCENCLIVFF